MTEQKPGAKRQAAAAQKPDAVAKRAMPAKPADVETPAGPAKPADDPKQMKVDKPAKPARGEKQAKATKPPKPAKTPEADARLVPAEEAPPAGRRLRASIGSRVALFRPGRNVQKNRGVARPVTPAATGSVDVAPVSSVSAPSREPNPAQTSAATSAPTAAPTDTGVDAPDLAVALIDGVVVEVAQTEETATAGPPGSAVALALSQKCATVFLERGTTKIPAHDLAAAAGVSLRTFHRYLDSREKSVRPILRAGVELVAEALRHEPAEKALGDAIVSAFALAASGPLMSTTLALVPLMQETPATREVWGQSIRDGEFALAAPIAARLGADENSPRAVVIATVATSLIRRSLEDAARTGSSPVETLREYMASLTGGPLADPAR